MSQIPRSRLRTLVRFGFGALIVVAFTATATAVAGLLQFKTFAAELSVTPALPDAQVTIANPGNPQTLLLIGSDHRAGEPWRAANTDTMMLVRLDPNSQTINMLSVPRDLKVDIPGYGTAKINASYSIGGPNLLLTVLKQQVFPGLHVNHIIDVNFAGFEALVNAIGCVYSDVDRRYYNNTAYTDYSSIDIQPGYQKLCGTQALEFVRYRHGDSDIVRNARQQDFLRWAKSQYSISTLISNRDTLIKIFGEHTQTDHNLHTVDGLINLFNLVAFSAGHTIKQIPFPAIFQPCGGATPNGALVPCYVTADPVAEARAFQRFMTPTTASGVGSTASSSGKSHSSRPPSAAAAGLSADVADGKAQAAQLARAGFPVYYPRLIVGGTSYCTSGSCPIGPIPDSYPRTYALHDQSGGQHSAYRITLVINQALGEFYGVQGTTWTNPPILNNPTETKTIGGRQLLEFFNGHKLSVVGWRTPQAAYWVSNTLTDSVTNTQMLGIAASLTKAR